MQPEESQVDPERGSPAVEGPDNLSVPLPILLRVPWFPPEPPASVAAASEDAGPSPEVPLISPAVPVVAWKEPESPRRRWPVLAALAGCLSAIAIGAAVDELWWSRPAVRPQIRRAAARSQAAAPAAEIEPLLAIPSASRPAAPPEEATPVRAVSLAPDIIPIESGEEP